MADQPNIDKNYQGSRRIFSLLPARSREMFDKALLGRMAKKNLMFKDEKDVARKVKYRGEETYPMARAATNPVVAGVAGGAFAHTWGKYKYPALKHVYEKYEELGKKKDPIAAQLRKAMASKVLKNPKTGTMYKSLEELKAVTQKTPKQLRNKAILMGLATAGVTALGRFMHPRALKGEALHSATEYKHRDPSEYIRTKLREDVQLRKISHMTKKAHAILEKQARVWGETIPDYVTMPHAGIDRSERMLGLTSYFKAKAKEPKTSWGKALLTGGGIGAGIGALAGGLIGHSEGSMATGAAIGGGVMGAMGVGIGAIAKTHDDAVIEEAKRVMKTKAPSKEIKKHLRAMIAQDQVDRDWEAERRHQEVLDALEAYNN